VNSQELELRDVRGPSALGGGMRRAGELLYLMASFEFRRAYFGTVLGYVWSICRPLLLFAVLLAVFTRLVRFSNVPHYPELLLLNVVLFGFFQEATTIAVGSIVGAEGIVRKTQFPRLVIPLSVVLTTFFNLGLNLLVAFAFVLGFGITPAWRWLLVVPLLVALFVITTAVAMIVSSLFPRFRDVQIIWSVLATVLFYGTPTLYPIWGVSHTLRDVIALNPLAPMFDLAQKLVTNPNGPWPWEPAAGGVVRLIVALALYLAVAVFAVWLFNREAPRIAEEL
jgi:ABC-2 type transport system permease protein